MRIKWLLFAVLTSIVSIACAKPVIISGGDLPEDQRALFAAGSGIEIHTIDGAEVDGSLFILSPGSYSIEFTSRRDMKKANQMLKGILNIADCKTDISLDPGEELVLSSRLKAETGSVVLTDIEHIIKFKSSMSDERSKELPLTACEQHLNCDRADRLQIIATGCD